jgi:hypothetical protein
VARATARLQAATASLNGRAETSAVSADDGDENLLDADGDSPINVREKVHASVPMGLDQALFEMELVGHDFYLFHDKDTDQASVVYRRRAWDYGVIHLAVSEADARVS